MHFCKCLNLATSAWLQPNLFSYNFVHRRRTYIQILLENVLARCTLSSVVKVWGVVALRFPTIFPCFAKWSRPRESWWIYRLCCRFCGNLTSFTNLLTSITEEFTKLSTIDVISSLLNAEYVLLAIITINLTNWREQARYLTQTITNTMKLQFVTFKKKQRKLLFDIICA